jgi:hypothetical protein
MKILRIRFLVFLIMPFQSFLRSDAIAYSLKPVNSYQDIVSLLQGVDPQSYRSIVFFNCGANIDLEGKPIMLI